MKLNLKRLSQAVLRNILPRRVANSLVPRLKGADADAPQLLLFVPQHQSFTLHKCRLAVIQGVEARYLYPFSPNEPLIYLRLTDDSSTCAFRL